MCVSLICLRHPEMTKGEKVDFDVFELGRPSKENSRKTTSLSGSLS